MQKKIILLKNKLVLLKHIVSIAINKTIIKNGIYLQ